MTPTKTTSFIGYLHSFRGFAIINIVLIHAVVAVWLALGRPEANLIMTIADILFHDSTLYFAVISGILFTLVLKHKGYPKFYMSKLKFIIIPYVFISIILVLFKVDILNTTDLQTTFSTYLSTLSRDLVFGKADFVLWYIPVLLFLFIITPLLDYLMLKSKATKFIFALIILAPLIVSRVQMAFEYIIKIETMIYFTGAYALGMYMGLNMEKNLKWIKDNVKLLISVTIICTAILFFLTKNDGNSKMLIGVTSLTESIHYIHKICLAALFMLFFKSLGENQPKWLSTLARDSFAIYFLHGFILFGNISVFMYFISKIDFSPLNIIIGSIILLVYSILLSMLIVRIFKKLFGKKSRMFIGS